ncbi:hypothetical protein DdX_12450 [Ditylenchus destructor]|uniref:Uncharacterized protein n=1 Tax=Ditylenchus destructor TaxID=166010 RepID=A0AAD4MW03_9BILA|nr:hypothetical protein DdX_13061 [Ditylenchus destructor]KAI1707354.1 hypothetical protein DdX_12450 [Ditylenchus destructor]
MLPSSREDDRYQNQPDPSGAWEDMASRNPGNPGFGAWANFSRPTRIGPSDSSKCSPAQGKTIGTKISPIRAGRGKIWLPEIQEILDLAHGPTFHAPLGSGRVIAQNAPQLKGRRSVPKSARSERGVGRYGFPKSRKSWIWRMGQLFTPHSDRAE